MATPVVTIVVSVSEPYHVEGFHGSSYGTSRWTRRDYTASAFGRSIKQTTKSEISSLIRQAAFRNGVRANIEFVSEA
jgi:hypothetical protein